MGLVKNVTLAGRRAGVVEEWFATQINDQGEDMQLLLNAAARYGPARLYPSSDC
jgi:hypothetical protein